MSWIQEANRSRQAIIDGQESASSGRFFDACLLQPVTNLGVLLEMINCSNRYNPDCPQLAIINGTYPHPEIMQLLPPSILSKLSYLVWINEDRIDLCCGLMIDEEQQQVAFIPHNDEALITLDHLYNDAFPHENNRMVQCTVPTYA